MKQHQSFMGWLLLCMHLLIFHFPSSSSFNFLCHHDESFALLQFKSSFTIDIYPDCEPSHLKTATWKNGSDCCSWNGVTCDTISGHVIGLNLGCEGIAGELHPNSTLFDLPHLQSLNLSYIHFFGSPFHFKFGGFLSLTHLDLSKCNFKGEVPIQISHLSKLESLHLSVNEELVWKETTLKRLVQNATNLKELLLDETDMSLIRPNSVELIFNQSSSLITLNLHNSRLSGKLKKSLFCLPNIQELDMSYNDNLEGQLPELSCSTSLRILDLSNCPFKKGPIPLSFSNSTHLTSLGISANNLNGSIPSSLLTLPHLTYLDASYNALSGQIPNVFPQSNRFQELDLSDNKIGGEIPSSLSNLQQLTHLYLSSNLFSGRIPNVFGRMTELQYLNLADNNLEGQIPSSLFNLNKLVELYFSDNKLEGPLPNKISGFQNLTGLNLNDNLLNGTIPLWCLSLPSLREVDLSNNRLTWHVDDAFSSNSLEALYLNNNMLQGNIPESIFRLANLKLLWLYSNNLSGLVNFQIFSKLQNLSDLSISQNSQLSLYFESNVSYSFNQLLVLKLASVNLIKFHKLQGNFTNLVILDLFNNKLNGMPNCLIETAGQLRFLNLSQNMFTSADQLIEMAVNTEHLSILDLSFNLLNGDIPLAVCNISSMLAYLNLGHNNLSGIIPQCFSNFQSLQFLDLQMNKFHGTLPSNFSEYITMINLNGNLLEGLLPKSLSHCKSLRVLNLGSNRLEDKFPVWPQTMQHLKVLVLRDNRFHGPIANLKIKHLFPSLVIFDISGNNFSGFLPKAYFKNYEAMKNVTQVGGDSSLIYMEFSCGEFPIGDRCTDSVTVTTKGNKLTLGRIPKFFVSIDLSRNKFEGEIPNAIGDLHALKGLNLSHNRLIGHIPQSIGNLTYLESLDLSSNMLTGVIPAELTNMNSIEVLNLSNNHLTGEIPQGRQFNTFTNDSYEGNLGLCGFPLTKKCGPEPEQHQSPPSTNNIWSEEKFEFGWRPVAIGYGCGFVIGIGLGYLVFLIGKPRWLVIIFDGQPKRRVNRRRNRVRTTNGSTQMVPMS
ncbi:receptor like protein 22-like [Trifolium pratense]|uniref:receptor like protein 22-like n=1 Tax=Trifolium pratense TaxID=57577 RepID=UPI001E6963C5|nr:receptor like protein 22-like [Trifolium pratense]